MAGGKYEKQYLDGLNITKTILNNISIRSDIHYYRQDTLIALRHKEWKIYIKDPNPWDDEITQKDMPVLVVAFIWLGLKIWKCAATLSGRWLIQGKTRRERSHQFMKGFDCN